MYEEEDDDLPAQYQRLNAHLHTTSVMFNKKLHDYIATQHGVRNMFMSQYQNAPFQPYGNQYSPTGQSFSQANTWLNNTMLPPQPLSPSTPQGFQQAQPYSPTAAQPQGFRRAPYNIPQRTSHQRSFSLQLPNGASFFDPSAPQPSGGVTTPGGVDRRLSLPPTALEQPVVATPTDGQRQFSQSQSPAAHSPQSVPSPATGSIQGTPQIKNEAHSPTSYSYTPTTFSMTSQVLNTNPLTMSLPPESQQFVGSALDPNDPRTALFMAGSDGLPQHFNSNYAYNAGFSKPSMAANVSNPDSSTGQAQTLSSGLNLKMEPIPENSVSQASISDGFYSKDAFLTPGNGEFNAFFDFSGGDFLSSSQEQAASDQLDGSNFVNWD